MSPVLSRIGTFGDSVWRIFISWSCVKSRLAHGSPCSTIFPHAARQYFNLHCAHRFPHGDAQWALPAMLCTTRAAYFDISECVRAYLIKAYWNRKYVVE